MSSRQAAEPVDASDDLDDLDDILDEFNATNKPALAANTTSKEGSSASTDNTASSSVLPPPRDTAAAGEENVEETEEEANDRFARELAVGMEALMKDLGGPGVGSAGAVGPQGTADTTANASNENLFDEQEMMKQFEQMMASMGLGGMGGMEGFAGAAEGNAAAATSTSTSASATGATPAPANFQDAIKSTMSRLRESDASASSSTGAAADGMDLEKLMAALGGAEGVEGEEGISKMLESMMGELMSREILYEPLNELKEKYPGYLANSPAALSKEDRARYEQQYSIVSQVIAIFDDPKFERGTESEKTALKAKVQNLMNEMQDNGAPPAEIVGDLPPELEGMAGLGGDENCSVM